MRAQFVLSEMTTGLRRNLTMTIAVVLTVAVSLSLAGVALLTREQVSTMKGFWYDKVEVSVFLTNEVTQAQRDSVNADLSGLPQVQHVFYESKADAYRVFKDQFKDSPDLVRNVTPDALPESFRVKLYDPTQLGVVAGAVQGHPGVEEVLDQRKPLKRFFSVLNTFQAVAVAVALAALLASALLIINTIQVAAYTRRRETGIMRLVGASNLYIQLPFLLEGAVAGLVGALVASGAMAAIKGYLIDGLLKSHSGITAVPFFGWDAVWLHTVPWLLVVGVLLSALVSFVTSLLYLRV